MKKAALILNWVYFGISIFFSISYLILSIMALNKVYYYEYYDSFTGTIAIIEGTPLFIALFICFIGFVVSSIISLIFGIKVKNAICKEDIIAISVVAIIFCGVVPGILALCANDSEFIKPSVKAKLDKVNTKALHDENDEITAKIVKIKKLYEDGVITQEEYEKKRSELIDKL